MPSAPNVFRIRSFSFWQNDAKTGLADKDGCRRWERDPMALDPLGCPSSLSAQSGSDCAENNNTEVSTTSPDQLRPTKGADKKHPRGITVNRSPAGQGVGWPISYCPCSANRGLNSRSTRGVNADCTTHFTPRIMQHRDSGLDCKFASVTPEKRGERLLGNM